MTNDTNEYMEQLEWNDKLAVATFYRMQSRFGPIAYCFDNFENIYEYPLSILMRRDFPLVNELNKFIQYASSSGLLTMWIKQHKFDSPVEIEHEMPKINLETGFFLVLIYLAVVCGLLCLTAAERIIYSKVRNENSARIWRYIEMAIDPHRYFLLRDLSY